MFSNPQLQIHENKLEVENEDDVASPRKWFLIRFTSTEQAASWSLMANIGLLLLKLVAALLSKGCVLMNARSIVFVCFCTSI